MLIPPIHVDQIHDKLKPESYSMPIIDFVLHGLNSNSIKETKI